MPLPPAPPDGVRAFYHRGKQFPRAIAWFGARSFWGHLWHLAASVIATEDIDSRDWMQADPPGELTRRIAEQLGATDLRETLTDSLGADLWIDFVADTGDDVSVSEEVARLLFERYEVEDPENPGKTLRLPRGQLLLFGGDTAYPVATELEIHNRVVVPYNRVLRGAHDGKTRVLLGVPGNHDWYAGLDGFGRMFRARRGRIDRASAVATDRIDQAGQIGHFIEWIEAFRIGRFVAKRPALPLLGYVPLQAASYWAVRLAPHLDLWGVDRQLRSVDFHQRVYFADAADHPDDRGILAVLADPAYAFLEPNRPGLEILRALELTLETDGIFVLSGDTHHYCRQAFGTGMHVTAGGGGAFLHPARIARAGFTPPLAEFPGPRTSRALALQVPWQIAHGRSGFLLHLGLAAMYLAMFRNGPRDPVTTGVTAAIVAIVCILVGGWRKDRGFRFYFLALGTAAAVALLPRGLDWLVGSIAAQLGHWPRLGIAYVASVYLAALVCGGYLAALTILGLEQHQAFGALAHPGYKHFVRLRVRQDGSTVDAWVIGKVDPLSRDDGPVLVDRFTWNNPKAVPTAPSQQ